MPGKSKAPKKAKPKRKTEPKKPGRKPRVVLATVSIPEIKLKNAIRHILTDFPKPNECFPDICSQIEGQHYIPQPLPDSYFRMQYEVRNCILNENWYGLAQLLKIMSEKGERFHKYRMMTFKTFLISLLHDPALQGRDYLQTFLCSVFECDSLIEMESVLTELLKIKKVHNGDSEMPGHARWNPVVKEPEFNLDEIDMTDANKIRELFLGQKGKTRTNHNPTSRKQYRKK